jgi:uncharacterized protein DUF1003
MNMSVQAAPAPIICPVCRGENPADAVFCGNAECLLISQNRQNAHQDQRAELDYEVNVKTYRKLGEIQAALAQATDRLDALETKERDR